MVTITVNDLDEVLEQRLRIRASEKGVSVEQEVRDILTAVLCEETQDTEDLAHSIRARFAPFGGVELELPSRGSLHKSKDCRRY